MYKSGHIHRLWVDIAFGDHPSTGGQGGHRRPVKRPSLMVNDDGGPNQTGGLRAVARLKVPGWGSQDDQMQRVEDKAEVKGDCQVWVYTVGG